LHNKPMHDILRVHVSKSTSNIERNAHTVFKRNAALDQGVQRAAWNKFHHQVELLPSLRQVACQSYLNNYQYEATTHTRWHTPMKRTIFGCCNKLECTSSSNQYQVGEVPSHERYPMPVQRSYFMWNISRRAYKRSCWLVTCNSFRATIVFWSVISARYTAENAPVPIYKRDFIDTSTDVQPANRTNTARE
jgi:hypothetical protein